MSGNLVILLSRILAMATHSVRSLAARLDISCTTVSLALRGSPKVKASTRLRVVKEAERLGYCMDPVASELMARMRRSESLTFRGLIACILPEHDHEFSTAQPGRGSRIQAAAGERATELGFKLDFLKIGRDANFWMHLPKILHARGAVGLLLFPSDGCQPLNRAILGKEKYPVVQLDVPDEGAEHVDIVAPDYQHASFMAFRRLSDMGYRRPGLVLLGSPHAASNRCWLGAFAALRQSPDGRVFLPPPLLAEDDASLRMQIVQWAKDHGVDVVLAPGTISPASGLPFCSLDIPPGVGLPMGLDLRWSEIASRSIDIIARKHFDRLSGRVESPAVVSLPSFWRMADEADGNIPSSARTPVTDLPDPSYWQGRLSSPNRTCSSWNAVA